MFSQFFSVEYLRLMLLALPGIIIAISFHEFGHAWMADRLGDPTPRNQGRLTISPLAHIDPWGLLMLVLFRFGYGRPVQINPANFKNRKRDEILVSLAGVTINLVIAFVAFLVIKIVYGRLLLSDDILYNIILYTGIISVNLLIFNLLPVPPLDGYKVVRRLFIHKNVNFFWKLDQYGFIILLALLLLGVLTPILIAVSGFVLDGIFFILGL